MLFNDLTRKYSGLEVWFHDELIAERVLKPQLTVIARTGLADVFGEIVERSALDVGCGGGQMVLRLNAQYPHLQLTGVDLSEAQIKRAEQRAQQTGCLARFRVADAQALPFDNGMFDVVYSFASIKHWPDPRQGLAECWRVLKPGGELLVFDATSDATNEQIKSLLTMAGFPRPARPFAAAFMRGRLIGPARPVETYREIAAQVGIDAQSVHALPDMPAFMVRARKPLART